MNVMTPTPQTHPIGETPVNVEQRPFLSIVIPAHNEEHRLPPSLAKIEQFLKTQPYTTEIVIVENGSTDNTVQMLHDYAQDRPDVRVISVTTRGKGLAVKQGMLAARGEWRFICDADLSMPIDEIVNFLPPRVEGADMVIGSREGKGSRRIDEPFYRHLMGRVLNWIVKLTIVRGFEDTQCGFKMIRREAAEDLFSVQHMNGIGFDVELLFLAKKRGYKIHEMPITWYFDPDSRMRLVQDTLHILVEIWQIRRNWREGLYARQTPDQT